MTRPSSTGHIPNFNRFMARGIVLLVAIVGGGNVIFGNWEFWGRWFLR